MASAVIVREVLGDTKVEGWHGNTLVLGVHRYIHRAACPSGHLFFVKSHTSLASRVVYNDYNGLTNKMPVLRRAECPMCIDEANALSFGADDDAVKLNPISAELGPQILAA